MHDFDSWLSSLRNTLEDQIGPAGLRDLPAQRVGSGGAGGGEAGGGGARPPSALQDASRYDREAWSHSMARIQDKLLQRALDAEAEQEHLRGGGTLAPARGPQDDAFY